MPVNFWSAMLIAVAVICLNKSAFIYLKEEREENLGKSCKLAFWIYFILGFITFVLSLIF